MATTHTASALAVACSTQRSVGLQRTTNQINGTNSTLGMTCVCVVLCCKVAKTMPNTSQSSPCLLMVFRLKRLEPLKMQPNGFCSVMEVSLGGRSDSQSSCGTTTFSLRVEVLAYEISLVAIDTNQHHHLPDPPTQPSSTGETSSLLPTVEAHTGWQDVGSLEDLEANILNFPLTTYDLGVKYNSGLGAIHSITVNSWNRGIRVTVDGMYPQGDNGSTMALGTAVFVKGTDDSTQMWTHYYYHQAAPAPSACETARAPMGPCWCTCRHRKDYKYNSSSR